MHALYWLASMLILLILKTKYYLTLNNCHEYVYSYNKFKLFTKSLTSKQFCIFTNSWKIYKYKKQNVNTNVVITINKQNFTENLISQ